MHQHSKCVPLLVAAHHQGHELEFDLACGHWQDTHPVHWQDVRRFQKVLLVPDFHGQPRERLPPSEIRSRPKRGCGRDAGLKGLLELNSKVHSKDGPLPRGLRNLPGSNGHG